MRGAKARFRMYGRSCQLTKGNVGDQQDSHHTKGKKVRIRMLAVRVHVKNKVHVDWVVQVGWVQPRKLQNGCVVQ